MFTPDPEDHRYPCDTCGCLGAGYKDGRPYSCRYCCYAELETTEYIAALRAEFHLSNKVVQARLEKYGPPNIAPKEWLTPKSRLR